MNKKYVMSIDQGTTSTRAILFDNTGASCFISQTPTTCIYPKPGWVEQDAEDIKNSVQTVISMVLEKANITMDDVDSVGITNQRETTIVWDKKSGKPVTNAIVWQSRQTKEICDKFADYESLIHDKTGLIINPYFSASKIRFILDKIDNGQFRAENGELLCGTVDTWVIYNLTKGKVFATDVTNASRTMLFNIHTMSWDEELMKLFNIPRCMLPEVKGSSDDFGEVSLFDSKTKICGVCGDQQSALFGQTCFDAGDSKNTYGTGCFMLMNTGNKPVLSHKGLLTTVAWKIGDEVNYALEGSVFVGGAVIQWVRDELGLIADAAESEKLATSVPDSNGVYVVPAFVGLGAPYWDNEARGAIFGLTRGANKAHITRASLEAVCYQSKDVIEVMKEEASLNLTTLKVDGGATANNFMLQFQSDILNCNIAVPKCLETTALGVCYLAGLYTGFFKSKDEIRKIHGCRKTFSPMMEKDKAKMLYNGWKKAIIATKQYK